jgi:6-phosphofructokinase 1
VCRGAVPVSGVENAVRHIAVMTSGGDAPGMNAALRAVVRRAASLGLKVSGVRRGFEGLLRGEFVPLGPESVHDIIHRGGTILLTARCEEFLRPEGQALGARRLREAGCDALVCIGGDGSLRGCLALEALGVPTVGVPGTIDNDLPGTDQTIGFDTAVNTAVEAVDRVRDTATAHERTFVVEVMGRSSGFIALAVGMGCGAETILVPEIPWQPEEVCARLRRGLSRGTRRNLIVVAEGAYRDRGLGPMELGRLIEASTGLETRVTVLGHVQRGGSPTAVDRNLASRLGAAAVELLVQGRHGLMAGIQGGTVVGVPLETVVASRRTLDPALYQLAAVLSA